MSTKKFFDELKQPQSMGAMEATTLGIAIGLSAFFDGMGQVWDGAKPMFDHGRTEAAAALFSGTSGHVLYMHNEKEVEQPVKEPEIGMEI